MTRSFTFMKVSTLYFPESRLRFAGQLRLMYEHWFDIRPRLRFLLYFSRNATPLKRRSLCTCWYFSKVQKLFLTCCVECGGFVRWCTSTRTCRRLRCRRVGAYRC